MTTRAIETSYAGCRFRSRLEARWAVFFDTLGIPWEYEPEGFELPSGRYLPDFWLPECDTWIEVKGDLGGIDLDRLDQAAALIPERELRHQCERGPRLMILGPIPDPPASGDLGWISLDDDGTRWRCGFGTYAKNRRPWWHSSPPGPLRNLLTPTHEPWESSDAVPAYIAARSARFEFGQTPAVPVR
jgi:hypothetical protein